MRNETMHAAHTVERQYRELHELLGRMKNAGMSVHLPTLEEARAARRGEGETND